MSWSEYDWFDEFHERFNYPEQVLHTVSGGADSAFSLWFHCHYVREKGLNVTFNVFSDYDGSSSSPSKNFIKVFNFISKMEFPELSFGEHRVWRNDYSKPGIAQRRNEQVKKFKTDLGIDSPDISGTTMAPPISTMKRLGMMGADGTGNSMLNRTVPKNKGPFTKVAKDKIAELYQKYDIMDMFYLTDACIYMVNNQPCKECWWCKEKYWAFGMYDYGIS